MSFLVEDDQQATLEVALAFIEACDDMTESLKSIASPQQSSPSASTSSYEDSSSDHLDSSASEFLFDRPLNLFAEPTICTASVNRKASASAKSGKPRSNADAVRRLRARKKAEAAHLRDQVIELEAKLRQLQLVRLAKNPLYALLGSEGENSELNAETKEDRLTLKPKAVSVWLEIASIQAKERHKSEMLNVKLKEAIEKHMKTSALLENILRKKSNLHGLDLLWKDQQQDLYNDSLLTKEKMFFEELRDDIGKMYQMSAKLFERSADFNVGNMMCSTQVKQDPTLGSFVEVLTSAPLRGSFADAGELVWQQTLCKTTILRSAKYYMQKRNITDSSFQKSYKLTLDGPTGPVELHGISYVQKVDEPHRFVYMWTSRILLANGKASAFHERGWMVASKVDGHTKYPTVFQTCYRVTGSDPHRGPHPLGNVPEELKETVLDALTMRTREYYQNVQNMLVDELARSSIRRPLVVTAASASSMLADDDPQATLAAVMALIDASCAGSAVAGESCSGSACGSAPPDRATQDEDEDFAARLLSLYANDAFLIPLTENRPTDRRKQRLLPKAPSRSATACNNDVGFATRPQLTKKDEIVSLRHQVVELTLKLAQLRQGHQQTNHKPLRAIDDHNSAVLAANQNHGATQTRERYWLEAENAALKEAIDKNTAMINMLATTVHSCSMLHGPDAAHHLWLKKTLVWGELKQTIATVYHATDSVFDPVDATESITRSMNLREDAMAGPLLEMKMTIRLRMDYCEAGRRLWQYKTNVDPVVFNKNYSVKFRNVTSSSFEKTFILAIEGPGGSVDLQGTSYAEKFVEPNRTVNAWTSRVVVGHRGVRFREKGWLVLSKSADGKYPAVFQMCYQAFYDPLHDDDQQKDPEAVALNQCVLRELTSKTRGYQQRAQMILAAELSAFFN